MPRGTDDTDKRGCSEDIFHGNKNVLTKLQLQAVWIFVITENLAGRPVYSRSIREYLRAVHDVVLTRRRLGKLKCLLGLVFGEVQGADGAKESERVRKYRFEFCKERRERDRLPDEGRWAHRPVLGGTDESYVHSNHAGRFSFGLCETAWLDAVQQEEAAAEVEQRAAIIKESDAKIGMAAPGKGKGAKDTVYSVRASGKGRRAVIIECITELGAVKGSRCVWVVGVATGDYHANVNSDVWLHWAATKMVPGRIALSDANEGCSFDIIIDGAKYHVTKMPSYVDIVSLKKEVAVEYLELMGVKVIFHLNPTPNPIPKPYPQTTPSHLHPHPSHPNPGADGRA